MVWQWLQQARKPKASSQLAGPRSSAIDWNGLFVRRAVGFRLKPHVNGTTCEVTVRRHGGERVYTLSRDDISRLMALPSFVSAANLDPAWLDDRHDQDLVYYARGAPSRSCFGAPVDLRTAANLGLRSNLALTVAIADEQEVSPWVFMPRQGAFAGRFVAGCRFASMEAGVEAYACDLLDSAADPGGAQSSIAPNAELGRVLLDLLPLLDGRWSRSQVLSQLDHPDRDLGERLLLWMNACALLEALVAPPRLVGPYGDSRPERHSGLGGDRSSGPGVVELSHAGSGEVTWLGHACVLLRSSSEALLVDPLFFHTDPRPRGFPSPSSPPDPRALPRLSAVLITHGDNDHLNPHALARIPKHTPILIPAYEASHPYQVDMRAILESLHFTNIIEMRVGERWSSGETTVYAYPFEGEDWGLALAKLTYVVDSPAGSVYFSADSAPMPEVYRQIASQHLIDFAFLGVSGCQEPLIAPPRFGYGEFYATWLPRARRNEWQLHCSGPTEAAEAIRILAPRYAFGYAAGAPGMDMAHSDEGSHGALEEQLRGANIPTNAVNLAWGVPFALVRGGVDAAK